MNRTHDFNALRIPGCYWVDAPPDLADVGANESWNIPDKLGFVVQRLFWLTNIAPNQWRGRHAHRESILATFMTRGRCALILDDGAQRQTVELTEQGKGIVIGPLVWHELLDFSLHASVLVLASTRYNESEYIRDYQTFLRETKAKARLG